MIQLYCFGESGHSYKAALTLQLMGLEWEPVFVDFFQGEMRQDTFRDLNAMSEAPVMVDGDVTLSQSGVIQQYLVDKTGQLKGDDPYEVLRWTLWDNHKLSSQAGVLRFLMNFLPEEKRPAEVIGFLTGRLKAALKVLELRLADRPFVAGDAISIADLTCCGYLYYPEDFTFDRTAWPNIDAWLTRISAQPGWAAPYDLMPRAFHSAA